MASAPLSEALKNIRKSSAEKRFQTEGQSQALRMGRIVPLLTRSAMFWLGTSSARMGRIVPLLNMLLKREANRVAVPGLKHLENWTARGFIAAGKNTLLRELCYR